MNAYFRVRHFVARTLRRTPLMPLVRILRPMVAKDVAFQSSHQYWNARYAGGGDSGEGSYGALARYKSSFINRYIATHRIGSVIEFGCGDGNQASHLVVERFTGVDISLHCVESCRKKLARPGWRFLLLDDYIARPEPSEYDCALSLDVIYHLIEDQVYNDYLDRLFDASRAHVLIYSSNFSSYDARMPHIRHRMVVDDVAARFPGWELAGNETNPFAKDIDSPDYGSFAHFFTFIRKKDDR